MSPSLRPTLRCQPLPIRVSGNQWYSRDSILIAIGWNLLDGIQSVPILSLVVCMASLRAWVVQQSSFECSIGRDPYGWVAQAQLGSDAPTAVNAVTSKPEAPARACYPAHTQYLSNSWPRFPYNGGAPCFPLSSFSLLRWQQRGYQHPEDEGRRAQALLRMPRDQEVPG